MVNKTDPKVDGALRVKGLLRKYAASHNTTLTKLAQVDLGVSYPYFSKVINGKQSPSHALAVSIADLLALDTRAIFEMFGFTNAPEDQNVEDMGKYGRLLRDDPTIGQIVDDLLRMQRPRRKALIALIRQATRER